MARLVLGHQFVFIVFRDESTVAPMPERVFSGCNICPADVWGDRILSQEKDAQLKTSKKLKTRSSLLVSLNDTSQPPNFKLLVK